MLKTAKSDTAARPVCHVCGQAFAASKMRPWISVRPGVSDLISRAASGWAEGNEHPQGDKTFNGKTHQCFGHQNITQVKNGMAELVYRSTIEEGLYPDEVDYTTMAL